MFACLCCTVFGGRSMRARHQTRWWSNGLKSVDGAMQYSAEESQREGEFFDHISKGQLPARAHKLVVEDTAAPAAHTTFGTDLARALFTLPANPRNSETPKTLGIGAPPRILEIAGGHASAGAGTSGFTFGSLLSGSGNYKGADAPPTPHKFRI